MTTTHAAGDRTPASGGLSRQQRRAEARRARTVKPRGGADRVLALQAAAGNSATHALLAPPSSRAAVGSGAPLPADIRGEMQERLGHDFGGVRIHRDESAADAIGANALTVGSDVHFGAGRFAPGTADGKRLLAHELAHVVQQSRGGPSPAFDPRAPHEVAARNAASAVTNSAGPVPVRGATGVGVAADLRGWLQKRYEENVPPAVREEISEAKDYAVDTGATLALGPDGPALVKAGYAEAQDLANQIPVPTSEDARNFARDKIDEAVGGTKGAVGQLTGAVDTLIWVGNEAHELKKSAVTKVAKTVGADPEAALAYTRVAQNSLGAFLPGIDADERVGDLVDGMKSIGMVDESGKASTTDPALKGWDMIGDLAIDAIGAKKEDDENTFSKRDIAEISTAVGVQVGLAFTGEEEVKVGLSVLGFLGGIEGIVETIRANPNGFYKEPSFWSGVLSAVLSIVGLSGGSGAGKKIISMLVTSGAVMTAVPPLIQLYKDYDDPALQANPEERKKKLKADWQAALSALLLAVKAIIDHGRSGKPIKPKGSTGDPETKSTTPATSTESGETAGQKSQDLKEQRAATDRAKTAEGSAQKREAAAKRAADEAQRLKKSADRQRGIADRQREAADKKVAKATERQAEAKDKTTARDEARQKAEAQADQADAKAQKKLDRAATRADEAAKTADRKAARAQTSADDATARAERSAARAQQTEARAKQAQADAKKARTGARRSRTRARKAWDKANSLTPQDPNASFAGLNEPGDATLPGRFKPNTEPIVWIRTGDGKVRGTYVPEGDRRFGKGPGVAKPLSEANKVWNARPAGSEPVPDAIKPRTINGRQVESRDAGAGKAPRFISATAEDPVAVKTTSIGPDIAESRAYNYHLDQGEVGLQRPLGSNLPGVDSITARIQYDAQGRPIRADIYLNDVTTPTKSKGPKDTHANWQQELTNALKNADPGDPKKSLFGDPDIDRVLLKAAEDGDVHLRIVRVHDSPSGKPDVRINPAETWRVGPAPLPTRVPVLVAPPRREDDEEEEQP